VGIDPGIKTALTLVEQSGRVVQYDAPLPLKLLSAKKRRIERKVSRAYEARKLRNGLVGNKAKGPMGSNERSLRNDLAKLSAQIADIRRQWQHRTTDEICRRYSVIRIQPSIGPIKSGKGTAEAPGKKIRQRAGRNRKALDIGIGEICRQLLYKADWYGAGYEEVDQFFPSSQLCSKCFEKMVRMV
jgi:putative transposase